MIVPDVQQAVEHFHGAELLRHGAPSVLFIGATSPAFLSPRFLHVPSPAHYATAPQLHLLSQRLDPGMQYH